jgi:PAS domain S-box-containing protein
MDEQGSSRATTNATAPDSALLKAAVEAVADAVVVTSPELDLPGPVIEYVNPAFTAMTGYAADEVIGRSPRFLHGPTTNRAVLDKLRAELDAGGPSKGELVNYRKDGSEYYVEWLISALRDDAGRVRYWVSAQRDVTVRRRMEERQAVLIGELQHRTRNLLAVVHSVANSTLESSASLDDFKDRYEARLAALARVNGLLSCLHEGERIAFDELIRMELSSYGTGGGQDEQITLEGPRGIRLRSSTMQIIALGVHELATNAVKYGALSRPDGRLRVAWRVVDSGENGGKPRLRVEWEERGVVAPSLENGASARKGYGRELIEHALPYQLGAEVAYELGRDGVRCTITLPISLD